LNHGAVIGEDPVGKRNLGAGALQQGPGDENAKAEAGSLKAFLTQTEERFIATPERFRANGSCEDKFPPRPLCPK